MLKVVPKGTANTIKAVEQKLATILKGKNGAIFTRELLLLTRHNGQSDHLGWFLRPYACSDSCSFFKRSYIRVDEDRELILKGDVELEEMI